MASSSLLALDLHCSLHSVCGQDTAADFSCPVLAQKLVETLLYLQHKASADKAQLDQSLHDPERERLPQCTDNVASNAGETWDKVTAAREKKGGGCETLYAVI